MNYNTANVERLIEDLVTDERYVRLSQIRPEFDLFEILGSLSETSSSRVLAFLLDSESTHGLGVGFYNHLLWELLRAKQVGDQRLSLRDVLRFEAATTEVTTEWSTPEGRRLDILVQNFDSEGRLRSVLGIENKHWAIEQSQQLADYQRAIADRFFGVPAAILFLAPGARLPMTADAESSCPCIPCSYAVVIAALHLVEQEAEPDVRLLISNLWRHYDKSMEGGTAMNETVRDLVRELYRNQNHHTAIRHIVDNLPYFGYLADRIVDGVQQHFSQSPSRHEFGVFYWPQRNRERLYSIQLIPLELDERTAPHGFRIRYVLNPKKNCNAVPDIGDVVGVQLMVWLDHVTRKDAADRFFQVLRLPPTPDSPYTWHPQWKEVWAVGTCVLDDLGDTDIQACVKLFKTAIDLTYTEVREAVHRLSSPT